MKMKAAGSSETSVATDVTIRRSNSNGHNIDWLHSSKVGEYGALLNRHMY